MSERPGTAGAEASARERLRAIEATIEDLGRVADPRSLAGARALVAAVLSLHADGLARALEVIRSRPEGASLVASLAADDVVASLLLLHGLHPVPLAERVRASLAKVVPIGWALDLTELEEGHVRVAARRVVGAARAVKAAQVRVLVEEALEEAAPDAEGVEVTAADEDDGGFVPVERLTGARAPAAGNPR
jgi:hypothetical protein